MRIVASTLLAFVLAAVPSVWAENSTTNATTRPTTPAPNHPSLPTLPVATIPPPFLPPVTGNPGLGLLDRIGSCRTRCPNSLLCVGSHCLPAQPICGDWGCYRGQFCDSPFNSTHYGAYNDATLSGKIALTRGNNGQVTITIDASLSVNATINFTDFIHHIHDGGYIDGICKPLTPVCNATSCGPRQVCAPYEGCKRCEACGDIDLTPLLNGHFDPSTLTQRRNLTRGDGHGDRVGSGDLAIIPKGYNAWANLTFGDDIDIRLHNGSCITTFDNNTWADIDRLLTNIEQAAIQIAQGARVAARDVAVIANATLEWALAGDGARCGTNRSLSLNGSLFIHGSATDDDVARGLSGGRFDFPQDAGNNTIGVDAIANVAGGVELTGDLGTLKLSIAAAGAASASCRVPRNGSLHTSTDVLGINAEVIVHGSLNITGQNFQPKLSIPQGGNVTIDVGRDGNFTCGHLNLTRGGHVELHSRGNNTFFANLTCEWNSTLRIRVDSIASLRNRSTVLFTYSTLDIIYRSSFHCSVELFDDNQTLPLLNPNNVQASRRLLADAGTVTWTDNGAYATSADQGATPIGGNTDAPTTPAPTTDAPTGTPVSSSSTGTKGSNSNTAAHATPTLFTIALIVMSRFL